MSDQHGKEVSYVFKLRQWFGSLIKDVPEHYQVCEFECRESQCVMGDWEKCEIRLKE